MAEKTLNSRIIHKHDTAEHWELAVNFIPKQGEIIVYDIDATHDYERFKIGDGKTLVSALPFADDAVKESIEALNTAIGNVDSKVDAVNTLVGDASVSEQINTAIEDLEFTDVQIINWGEGDTSSSAGETTEEGASVVYIGNNINVIPSLSSTQKAQMVSLMDDYMNNKSLFTYNGTYRRESYAYANTSDGSDINGCVEVDTGKYFLNCGLFAQMVWMGRAISDYTTTPTTAITKAFDWGYYFDFLEAKRAYGVTRADGSYYGHNTFVNDAGTTKFLSLDGASVMAKELFRKGYEIPYSEVEVGDLVFYRKRNISDASEDDFEQSAFRYISHVGIVYSVDPVYGPMIYESTDAFTSGMGKFGLGDDASAYGNIRAVDLETRVCMAARHPAAWGNGGNVPSNFEVYRGTEVQS